jgi:hypothetical protein
MNNLNVVGTKLSWINNLCRVQKRLSKGVITALYYYEKNYPASLQQINNIYDQKSNTGGF